MRLPFRRLTSIFFLCIAILLVACQAGGCVTRTPTPEATEMPKPTPGATPQAAPSRQVHPYIPVFGSFPPKPVPARPANINPLTGLPADPALLQRRPLLVRIGNDARVRSSFWQAGTASADLVFEELIDQIGDQYTNTRLTAVFLSKDAPLVGPVRSGRLINLQLVPMFDGAVAHAGASDGVRWIFSQAQVLDLDEFFNMPAYCYNNPHGYIGRLYTTLPRLREWIAQKELEKPVSLYGFTFSDIPPQGSRVNSIGITRAPWPKWSAVEWRYDPNRREYLRVVEGDPLVDNSHSVTAKWGNGADCVATSKETRTYVTAANVVVLYAKHERTDIIEDANNALSVYIKLIGRGEADIFRDGIHIRGKWQRNSAQEFFEFVDGAGNVIPLKPGKTWFEIVPIGFNLDI